MDPTVQRAQVIFVDDKVENVAAAEKFGFIGIVYNAKHSPSSVLAAALVARGVPEADDEKLL